MRFFAILMTFAFLPALLPSAFAGYDKKIWHIVPYWSGEYPNGFSVIKPGTKVPARTKMDPALPKNISCELPYLAVFHQWNLERTKANKAEYVSTSKIIPMIAKKTFKYEFSDQKPMTIKKGELLEFLIFKGEGFIDFRYKGKIYEGEGSIFENFPALKDDAFVVDEWLQVKCVGGQTAWISYFETWELGESGRHMYMDGLGDMGPAMEDYGKVRDLTEAEAEALRNPQALP